jgi:hypothetical protein
LPKEAVVEITIHKVIVFGLQAVGRGVAIATAAQTSLDIGPSKVL